MTITTLPSIPAGENPFLHDFYHMGKSLGNNALVMFAKFESEYQSYIILIDVTTGQRIRIDFAPGVSSQFDDC